MEHLDFRKVKRETGTEIKSTNTIIEKWPIRLKLRRGQHGSQEEFDSLIACPHDALNCYTEWKRIGN